MTGFYDFHRGRGKFESCHAWDLQYFPHELMSIVKSWLISSVIRWAFFLDFIWKINGKVGQKQHPGSVWWCFEHTAIFIFRWCRKYLYYLQQDSITPLRFCSRLMCLIKSFLLIDLLYHRMSTCDAFHIS